VNVVSERTKQMKGRAHGRVSRVLLGGVRGVLWGVQGWCQKRSSRGGSNC